MSNLARFAGPLALLGGAVWVVATLVLAITPTSFAWLGLIVAMALIGGAAFALQQQLGAGSGGIGRWAAFATAAGAVGTLALVVIALVTTGGNMATTPPTWIVVGSLVAFLLWLIGSIVFALSLIRAKAIQPIAGWLVVVGAVVGTVALMSQNSSPIFVLPMALYGVGWVLVGLAARTPARTAELGVAGQAS